VVKQGEIIKTDLDPTKGHEQAGYRPALVVSPALFTKATNLTLICPITNTDRKHAMHIKLEETRTTGFIMTEQVRAVDLKSRQFRVIERIEKSVMEKVSNLIKAYVDVLEDYFEDDSEEGGL
jgi:mRNA interferase MazF